MNWPYLRPWLATASRLILGALFLWSGLVKLTDPRAFFRGVVAYDATPDWLSRGTAFGLPVLELCIGLMLVIGILTRIPAIAALILQVVFLIGVIELGARGIKVDTGAFSNGGVTTHPTTYLLMALLNVVLIVLASGLVLWPYSRLSLDEFLTRGDYVAPPSAKRMRNDQGRRKYESDVAAAERHARERNRYLTFGIVLPVVLISFISIGVQAKRAVPGSNFTTNASHVEGVSVGSAATVTVDVFEDFQSRASLAFEQQVGARLDAIAAETNRQVRYHMVAIYDPSSNGNRYSSRASNASLCVSDISTKDFRLYHRYLFGVDGNGKQIMPAIGSHGRTDGSLITYAQDALGISGTDLTTLQGCVQGETHAGLVEGTTMNFANRGYTNVPLVLVNGVKLSTLTVAGLDKAVAAAAAKSPPKPAVTPSATSTAAPVSSASVVPLSSSPASP